MPIDTLGSPALWVGFTAFVLAMLARGSALTWGTAGRSPEGRDDQNKSSTRSRSFLASFRT